MFKLFKKIYKLSEDHRKQILTALVLKFLDSFLALVPLFSAIWFFQNYVNKSLNQNSHLVALAILAGSVLVRVFVHYYIDKYEYSTVYITFAKERIKIADHLKKINMGFFTNDNIGRITTVLTNGITFIEEQSMVAISNTLTSLVSVISIFFVLCFMDVGVAIIYAIICVVVFILLYFYQKKSRIFANEYNKATEFSASAVIEYVKNISVIKAFNLIGKHKRSNEAFTNQRRVDISGEIMNIKYLITALVFTALGGASILFYVVNSYTNANIVLYTMTTLGIFSLYAFRSIEVVAMKIAMLDICADNLTTIEKLHQEEILVSNNDLKPDSYDIEFKNVSFAYEKDNILNNISFKLKENTMNALVGLSGSGKSTLVNLIPRFFDIQQGEILIGGINIKDMSTETLYDCISMVFQNVYLFKDTIYNNIAFGNDGASYDDVVQACKKAKCYDFIMNLPEQFETPVGEAGLSLSGGERQRISIARAILKNSPIILLDEATASVDPDNESEIQEAINALVKDKTILVIAHKLSCVTKANNILVLKDGALAEQGNHPELLAQKGLYENLWQKRISSKSWKIAN
ncbi:MAG: ABC transporter ATP-binding protein [Spirochaetales bacterium]